MYIVRATGMSRTVISAGGSGSPVAVRLMYAHTHIFDDTVIRRSARHVDNTAIRLHHCNVTSAAAYGGSAALICPP